jgi:hypothetical protein
MSFRVECFPLLQTSSPLLSGDTAGANKATYTTNFGGSIIVGKDSGSVGTYNQTGGTVSAWRFAVGDYTSETSGGGVSSATVSGGSLTTYELDVAFSANGSSSGSSFNVAGGNVTVNGDVILGEFGKHRHADTFQRHARQSPAICAKASTCNNTSNFRMDGGLLDMTVKLHQHRQASLRRRDDRQHHHRAHWNQRERNRHGHDGGRYPGNLPAGTRCRGDACDPRRRAIDRDERHRNLGGSTLSLAAAHRSPSARPASPPNQVNVNAGGTLAGDGTMAAAVNNSGGTISPGHSVGTLNINGNLTLGVAGVIDIELGAGANDAVYVSGAATLAGTVRVKDFRRVHAAAGTVVRYPAFHVAHRRCDREQSDRSCRTVADQELLGHRAGSARFGALRR